jgi:hypothetical protein
MIGALVDYQTHRAFGRMRAHVNDRALEPAVRHRRHGNEELSLELDVGAFYEAPLAHGLHDNQTNPEAWRREDG